MEKVQVNIKDLKRIQNKELLYQYYAGTDGCIYVKKYKDGKETWIKLKFVVSNKKDRYYGVFLAYRSGKKVFHYVHRLVTNAFWGDPKIKGWKIYFRNHNERDTRPCNLVWRLKKDLSLYDILYEDEWQAYQDKLERLHYISEMQNFNNKAMKLIEKNSKVLLNKRTRQSFIRKLLK